MKGRTEAIGVVKKVIKGDLAPESLVLDDLNLTVRGDHESAGMA